MACSPRRWMCHREHSPRPQVEPSTALQDMSDLTFHLDIFGVIIISRSRAAPRAPQLSRRTQAFSVWACFSALKSRACCLEPRLLRLSHGTRKESYFLHTRLSPQLRAKTRALDVLLNTDSNRMRVIKSLFPSLKLFELHD